MLFTAFVATGFLVKLLFWSFMFKHFNFHYFPFSFLLPSFCVIISHCRFQLNLLHLSIEFDQFHLDFSIFHFSFQFSALILANFPFNCISVENDTPYVWQRSRLKVALCKPWTIWLPFCGESQWILLFPSSVTTDEVPLSKALTCICTSGAVQHYSRCFPKQGAEKGLDLSWLSLHKSFELNLMCLARQIVHSPN